MESVFDVSPSSDQETIAMEAMLENYPDNGLLRVCAMPNADFSDPDAVPSGIISIHPVNATVHPDSVPNELFEYLVVCKAHPKDPEHELTDADFAGGEKTLAKEIPQYSTQPPRLRGVRSTGQDDLAAWSPELGKRGYVGVYKQASANGRDADYYIVARAGAPLASEEFRRMVVNGEKRTFKELMLDPSYNFTRTIAKRNAERLAYCAAQLLGVRIPQVVDVSAHARESYIAKPYRAGGEGVWSQGISSIEPISFSGKECAGVYHKVRSARKSAQTCFVAGGPYDGVVIFNMKGFTKGRGMPADTGRDRASVGSASASDSTMKKRARGFTWEQRLDDHHADLVPGKHGKIDDAFLRKMGQLGWRQEGVENRQTLVPLAVKLGNPEMERK